MEPEESSTLCDTPFLVIASAIDEKNKYNPCECTNVKNKYSCGNLHNSLTKGINSWFGLRGRTEHLYGATVAGKLKYCNRENGNQNWQQKKKTKVGTNLHLNSPFSVHLLLWCGMYAQRWCTWSCRCQRKARWRWEQLPPLHKNRTVTKVEPEPTWTRQSYGVSLTVQSLLLPLHAHHVLREFECLPFSLDVYLSMRQQLFTFSKKT